MLISKGSASLIANFFYNIDIACRKDLSLATLISERDYVSRLMTHAMYPFGPFINSSRMIYWRAQTLPFNPEVIFGCDSIIIFKLGDSIKIGLFEAKWPRISIKNYSWDNVNSAGVSRFSSELQRQHKWQKEFAIWEMFFNELPLGSKYLRYDALASSCVWHDYAYNHKISYKTWKQKDIDEVFDDRDTHTSETNIGEIIYNILICN